MQQYAHMKAAQEINPIALVTFARDLTSMKQDRKSLAVITVFNTRSAARRSRGQSLGGLLEGRFLALIITTQASVSNQIPPYRLSKHHLNNERV